MRWTSTSVKHNRVFMVKRWFTNLDNKRKNYVGILWLSVTPYVAPWLGNAFRNSSFLWGNQSVTGGFPSQRTKECVALIFSLVLASARCWINSRVVGDMILLHVRLCSSNITVMILQGSPTDCNLPTCCHAEYGGTVSDTGMCVMPCGYVSYCALLVFFCSYFL